MLAHTLMQTHPDANTGSVYIHCLFCLLSPSTAQMIAISMLLLLEPGAAVTLVNPATFMPIAKALLYVSTVLTVTSGSGYLRAAWPALMGDTE